MDAKELFEELKQKAKEAHKYLEEHPEEANTVPSWMFSCFSTEKEFLLQGCSNVRHEVELSTQIIQKLSENNLVGFTLATLEIAQIMKSKQQELEEVPQWIQ